MHVRVRGVSAQCALVDAGKLLFISFLPSCPLLCRWVYEIDADSDGKVTRVEIVEWIMRNEDKGNSKEIDLQWSIYDSDHSGQVSWEEYRTVFLKSKMEYSS